MLDYNKILNVKTDENATTVDAVELSELVMAMERNEAEITILNNYIDSATAHPEVTGYVYGVEGNVLETVKNAIVNFFKKIFEVLKKVYDFIKSFFTKDKEKETEEAAEEVSKEIPETVEKAKEEIKKDPETKELVNEVIDDAIKADKQSEHTDKSANKNTEKKEIHNKLKKNAPASSVLTELIENHLQYLILLEYKDRYKVDIKQGISEMTKAYESFRKFMEAYANNDENVMEKEYKILASAQKIVSENVVYYDSNRRIFYKQDIDKNGNIMQKDVMDITAVRKEIAEKAKSNLDIFKKYANLIKGYHSETRALKALNKVVDKFVTSPKKFYRNNMDNIKKEYKDIIRYYAFTYAKLINIIVMEAKHIRGIRAILRKVK